MPKQPLTTAPPSHPDWFWTVIEETKPTLQHLVDWLEASTRDRIIEFQRTYEDTAQRICDYWSGPTVEGVTLSEDDTEDLCHWIVSQGFAFWSEAAAASDLTPFIHLYWAAEHGVATSQPKWQSALANPRYRGYQAPGLIAHAVFRARFSEALSDVLDTGS